MNILNNISWTQYIILLQLHLHCIFSPQYSGFNYHSKHKDSTAAHYNCHPLKRASTLFTTLSAISISPWISQSWFLTMFYSNFSHFKPPRTSHQPPNTFKICEPKIDRQPMSSLAFTYKTQIRKGLQNHDLIKPNSFFTLPMAKVRRTIEFQVTISILGKSSNTLRASSTLPHFKRTRPCGSAISPSLLTTFPW